MYTLNLDGVYNDYEIKWLTDYLFACYEKVRNFLSFTLISNYKLHCTESPGSNGNY